MALYSRIVYLNDMYYILQLWFMSELELPFEQIERNLKFNKPESVYSFLFYNKTF